MKWLLPIVCTPCLACALLFPGRSLLRERPEAGQQKPPSSDTKAEDRPGLHNFLPVSSQVYCGGEPEGEEGFQTLARLGVTMIVSVDGARPKVALARKYGLRYVHIPIGYDGI